MNSWPALRTYLFSAPGSVFHYYVPFIVAIALVAVFVTYHYLLEVRRRFRNWPPLQRYLDGLAAWSASLAGVAALLLLVRHGNVPVLAWRIWLYLYVLVTALAFLTQLRRLYGRLPRQLAANDNELLKRRYLPPANQRQVAKALGRRSGARR